MQHTFTGLELHWRDGDNLHSKGPAQRGDKDGACKAYTFVSERWGHAKPSSITAAAAKARAAKLGCAQ